MAREPAPSRTPGTTRLFSAHEPDVCRQRLDLATGAVPDPAALLGTDEAAVGTNPQLKERGGELRLRPPRRLGGVLTITSIGVGMRPDDGGGTIFDLTRRRPLWTRLIGVPPILLALLLVLAAVLAHQWGVLVVAAVALVVGVVAPRSVASAGDNDALRLVRFVAETCDAVPFEEPGELADGVDTPSAPS